MATPGPDPATQAKWKQEWEAAQKRQKAAETPTQDPVLISARTNSELATAKKRIAVLERTVDDERKRRRTAESAEAALRATPNGSISTAATEHPIPNVNPIVQKLKADHDDLYRRIISADSSDMASHTQARLKNFLESRKGDLDTLATQAVKLKKIASVSQASVFVLQESRDRAEAELLDSYNMFEQAKSTDISRVAEQNIPIIMATILSTTKKLQAFNRQIHIPLKAAIIKSEVKDERKYEATVKMELDGEGGADGQDAKDTKPATIAPTIPRFWWENSRLHSSEGLSLIKLLQEFKCATESSVRSAEAVESLQEQLRLAVSSQWQAETEMNEIQKALNIANLKIGLVDITKNTEQGQDGKGCLQSLKDCLQSGEEMRLEIIKLRDELDAEKRKPEPDPTPGSPKPDAGDEPFTRKEARALYKLLNDYIDHSKQYQKTIKTLELQLAKLKGDIDPSQLSPEDAKLWADLNGLKGQQKECEKYKQYLRDQLDALEKEGGVIETLRSELAGYRLKNEKIRPLEQKFSKAKTEIATLKKKIKDRDEIDAATSDEKGEAIRIRLLAAEADLAKRTKQATAEADRLRSERDKLTTELSAVQEAHADFVKKATASATRLRNARDKLDATVASLQSRLSTVEKNLVDRIEQANTQADDESPIATNTNQKFLKDILQDIRGMCDTQHIAFHIPTTLESALMWLKERCEFLEMEEKIARHALTGFSESAADKLQEYDRVIKEGEFLDKNKQDLANSVAIERGLLQDKITELEGEIVNLEINLTECEDGAGIIKIREELAGYIRATTREAFETIGKQQEAEKAIAELEETKKIIEDTKKALVECENSKTEKDPTGVKDELKATRDNLAKLQKALDLAETDVESCRIRAERCAIVEKNLTDAQKDLAKALEKLANSDKNLDETEKALARCEASNGPTNQEKALRERLKIAEAMLVKAKEAEKHENEFLVKTDIELTKTKIALDETRDKKPDSPGSKEQVKNLKEDRLKLLEQIEQLRLQIDLLTADSMNYRKQVDDTAQKLKECLESKPVDPNDQELYTEGLRGLVDNLEHDKLQLQVEVTEAQRKIDDLRKELDETAQKLTKCLVRKAEKPDTSRIEELTKKIDELTKVLNQHEETLKQTLAELDKVTLEAEAQKTELDKTTQKLKNCLAHKPRGLQLAGFKKLVGTLQAAQTAAQGALGAALATSQKLVEGAPPEDSLKAALETTRKLQQRATANRRQIESLSTELEETYEKLDECMKKLEDCEAKEGRAPQAASSEASATIEKLTRRPAAHNRKIEDLSTELEDVYKKLDDCLARKPPRPNHDPHKTPSPEPPPSPKKPEPDGDLPPYKQPSGPGSGPDIVPDPPHTPTPPPVTPPVTPPPVTPPLQCSPTPPTPDTPVQYTDGGNKKRPAPGQRLRRETRANKRREIEFFKNTLIKGAKSPVSPPMQSRKKKP